MTEGRGTTAVRQDQSDATVHWLTYRAFGLTWKTDIPWPNTVADPGDLDADVVVQLVDEVEIDRRWSGRGDGLEWYLRIDDALLTIERGAGGDFHLSHTDRLFHVSGDGSEVACATPDPDDPWWLRLLLDTVLWSTALLRGVEELHASAVEGERGVIAFLGGSGGGKTTLALELLGRGYRLFCDDVLALRREEVGVTAYPSPPFLNVPLGLASERELPVKPIATLGDEIWGTATHPSSRPSRLAHLVLLERAEGSKLELAPAQTALLELRPFCLTHGLVPERERALFDLCADLAAQVPVSHLRADLETEPSELADLVEEAVERLAATS